MKVRNLESLPALRYLVFCNVLHMCNVRAIPTYRVYRLCDGSPQLRTHTINFVPQQFIQIQTCQFENNWRICAFVPYYPYYPCIHTFFLSTIPISPFNFIQLYFIPVLCQHRMRGHCMASGSQSGSSSLLPVGVYLAIDNA